MVMRKIYLLFAIQAAFNAEFAVSASFNSLALSSGVKFTFPFEDKVFNDEKATFKYNAGFKLSVTNLTISFSAISDTVKFHDAAQYDANDFMKSTSCSYGMKYHLASSFLNMDIFAGTIHYKNSISRLKTPYFSSPSALRKPILQTMGISPCLPTQESEVKEKSICICASPSAKTHLMPNLEAAFMEGKSTYASLRKRFSLPFIPSGQISFTAASFPLERKSSTSWFMTEKPFPKKDYKCIENETNLLFPNLRLSYALGAYQHPFGGTTSFFRTQDYMLLGNFTMHTFFFLADSDLITLDGTSPHVKKQTCINPQYKFNFEESWLNIGILFQDDFKETKERLKKDINVHMTKCTLNFYTKKFSIYANGQTSYSTEDEFYKYGGQIRFYKNFKPLKTNLSFSYKNEEKIKNTYSISAGITPKKSLLSSLSMNGTFVEKNHEVEKKFSTSASFSARTNKIKASLKCEFSVDFK